MRATDEKHVSNKWWPECSQIPERLTHGYHE